jgi:hypothetical protein
MRSALLAAGQPIQRVLQEIGAFESVSCRCKLLFMQLTKFGYTGTWEIRKFV